MPHSLAWRVLTRFQPQSRSAPAVLPVDPARVLSAEHPRLRKCVCMCADACAGVSRRVNVRAWGQARSASDRFDSWSEM